MKRFFSILVSTALMLSAISFAQTTFGAEARANSSLAQRGKTAIRFAVRQIKEANAKLRYTIIAKYPQAIGARDPRFERLNRAIRSLVTEQVADFKKNFEAPEERMDTMGSYFDIDYSLELATNDLVSIYFNIDSYYEGAAHPNHNALTFNYSFETGKTLTLAELFKANSNYLKVISDYSIKALKKELGDNADSDWIQNGAGADEKNYRNWAITRRGLKINFDPYQVASYAEGPHEVVIPYSVLRNVIDPDGALMKVAGVAAKTPLRANNLPPRLPVVESRGRDPMMGEGIGPGRGSNRDARDGGGIGNGPGLGINNELDPNRIYNPMEVDVKARLLSKPEPQMTEAAKRNNVNGTVILKVVFSAAGQVANIRVVKGLPDGLSESAINAAQQIKFIPAMRNGKRVSQYIRIEYNFNSY